MDKRGNPHGVGLSGANARMVSGRCVCCYMPFEFLWAPKAPPVTVCEHCVEHYHHGQPETLGRKVVRLAEDHVRSVDLAQKMHEKAREFARTAQAAEERTRGVLKSRDEWRHLAAAVLSEHQERPDGRCPCDRPFPCPTFRAALAIAPSKAREALRRGFDLSAEEWVDGLYLGSSVARREADEPFDGLTG